MTIRDLGSPGGLGSFRAVLLWLAFSGLAWNLYAPVMQGGFVSDDWVVIVTNPYVQDLSVENVAAIVDPYGPPVAYAMNYSPVHLLFHAVEVELFGDWLTGYHAANVGLHALTAVLLVLLLSASGLHASLAVAAGTLFLAHPANVEAVAMIFQAKTTLSTAFALGALLLFWRHPLAATLLFALALLTKFTAVFALPAAAVMAWTRSADPHARVPRWTWLLAWAALLAVFAIPEFAAFKRAGQGAGARIDVDLLEQVRTIVAFAMRYLWMAATSLGVSAFQQPEPASSWLDPWWLAGLVSLGALGWRMGWALHRREEEAGYWMLAVAAFAPVSQIFPFPYPMADRYLYPILPGLLGGVLLAARPPAAHLERSLRRRFDRLPAIPLARGAGLALLLAVSLGFALRAHERTRVFVSGQTIASESARNYPDGVQAWIARAGQSARRGDAAGAAMALQEVERRGYDFYTSLSGRVAPVRNDPQVREVLDRMAQGWVARLSGIDEPFPFELLALAQAQIQVGQLPEAIATLERALESEPPESPALKRTLQIARARLAREASK